MSTRNSIAATLRSLGVGLVFTVAVVGLLLWLAGYFTPKLDAAHELSATLERPVGDRPVVTAALVALDRRETAVGTIRAVHETSLASQVLARVRAVNVQAGQDVKAGELLVQLDDEEFAARLQQAENNVQSAQASYDQAKLEMSRVQELFERNQAARIEYERVATALREAEANLAAARQAQREAATILTYTQIRSPIDGVVVDKQVEAGDTVSPGTVLLSLYDPHRMQLVASVRESLTRRLEVGQPIDVRIDALDLTCTGSIREIVPEAQAASRSFAVKVTGPCPPNIYSGMFGRLLIPLDPEQVLVIPRAAVMRVGQLDLVDVVISANGKDVLERRAVRLGEPVGDNVQVLSGLSVGERIAMPLGVTDSRPA